VALEDGSFPERCNLERIDLASLTSEDADVIQRLVRRHHEYTRSKKAEDVLRKWNDYAPKFVKVHPKDLKMATDARMSSGAGNG